MLTAKEFLRQASEIEKSIQTNKELIEKIREQGESINAALSPLPKSYTGKHGDIVGENAAKLVDLERDILSDYNKLLDAQKRVYELIGRVKPQKLQDLLKKRYLQNKQWDVIEEELNYNSTHIHRLHGYALKIFDEILKEGSKWE